MPAAKRTPSPEALRGLKLNVVTPSSIAVSAVFVVLVAATVVLRGDVWRPSTWRTEPSSSRSRAMLFALACVVGALMLLSVLADWRAGFTDGVTVDRFDGRPDGFLVWPHRHRIVVRFSDAPGDMAEYECVPKRSTGTQSYETCPAIDWERLRGPMPNHVRVIAMDGWIVGLETDGVRVLEPDRAHRLWLGEHRRRAAFGFGLIGVGLAYAWFRWRRRPRNP